MRIAIIGAGVAGLATAKVLIQAGHDVQVFDRTPDVGGVWSRTRRYPGVTTQSPKAQYSLSDFPMPKDYPEWPNGAQVQAYFAAYATEFGVDRALRLDTEVTAVTPAADGRWAIETARGPTGRRSTGSSWRTACSASPPCPAIPDSTSSPRPAAGAARAPSSTTPRRRAASTCWWSATASRRAT